MNLVLDENSSFKFEATGKKFVLFIDFKGVQLTISIAPST